VAKDVLIVGAGVAGLCTAYYAARRGHRVTVLERGGPDAGGCSFGNSGLIVPSHFVPLAAPGMVALGLRWMWSPESPFYVRPRASPDLLAWGWRFWRAATPAHVERAGPVLASLHLASRASFEELSREWADDFGLAQRGLLMLCKTEHGLEDEARTAERGRTLGVPADVLTAAEAARLDPDIRMDVAGAVFFPRDCHLSPERFMAALRREVERAGAAIRWNTEVTGWRAGPRRVEAVETTAGEVRAEEFVLAAGVWSSAVARGLGVSLPMQAGKGYSLTLPGTRKVPRVSAILSEARVAVTPMGDAVRFGGTMELSGLDPRINPARVRGIVRSVSRYYPELTPDDFRDLPAWCGFRPCSPDGLPYLGRFARFENVSAATGHAMMGVSLGPISGKLMAEILSGEAPSHDVAALRPDRYS
jgi:D-amino-acid dehydrogenase